MLYRLALLITTLGLTVPCASRADTIARYWRWQNLDQKTKALYAAGLLDGGNTMLILSGASGDAKYHTNIVALNNCTQCDGLSDNLLIDMIDDAYTKDPK
jgi:hypothetical protein